MWLQGAHLIPIFFYWYTTIFIPILHVANHLDVNIVVDSGLRAIASSFPGAIANYVYPTLNGEDAGGYEFAPPNVESCKGPSAFKPWPPYVCDFMEIAFIEKELQAAAAVDFTLNSTVVKVKPPNIATTNESSSISVISFASDVVDVDVYEGFPTPNYWVPELRHPLLDYIESFGIHAMLILLAIYACVELLLVSLMLSRLQHSLPNLRTAEVVPKRD